MTDDQPNRLDQIEAVLLRVATQQEANTLAITELTANAEADRKMIWAAMQQHDVTIARIDKLLDYLLGSKVMGIAASQSPGIICSAVQRLANYQT
jgi:hypothetical protein